MFKKLPTAWLQLSHQKMKLVLALSGVVFSVVIIFIQLGLQDALFDSAIRFHKSIEGDCFLVSIKSPSLISLSKVTQRHLSQILAFEEVEFVAPVYSGFIRWRNPDDPYQNWRFIFLVGLDLRYPLLNFPGVPENMEKLKQPYTVLYDRKSRPEFGPVAEQFENQGSVKTELKNYFQKNVHAEVVGLFDFGTSFGIDGTLITSSVNFLRFTNQQPKGLINIGVIKLKPGIEIKSFIEKVNPYLSEDIRIFTREEFIQFEKKYWASTTPIGFIFSLGVALGLIVGIVVVYQILYTNVSEYLPQYATLKAIGYKHQYLSIMVLQQSVFIAILGYIPGWLLSQLLYLFTKQATQLPIGMTLDRSLLVFTLAVFMCVFSGLTAVKKLKEADPADIF